MREQVLADEPLCRPCAKQGRVTQATIADHIKPKAEGGTDDRENYQPICDLCHVLKTAAEAKRAKARKA
ncbi:HNH endonuclease [Novosphingobium chloroacetimidivorans]|uniref:HNH endonuclease n=1 Tax=Novosphingobium chloroacetimidivorans TaxID=1428314 RepID=UPI001FE6D7C3|nr:HNH endonuclease signature motif containing protein [Novosphingobium chloroacetimidivorans]